MQKRTKSIQSTLYYAYSSLIAVSVIVFVVFFYAYTSRLMTNRATEALRDLSSSLSSKLDSAVEVMDTISMNVCYSNLIKSHFYRHLSYSPEQKIDKLQNSKVLMDIFIAIIGPFETVKQLNLFDFGEQMIAAGIHNELTATEITEQPWYEAVMNKDGAKHLVGPHRDPLLERALSIYRGQLYISLCRIYFDSFRNIQGVIEVKQDYMSVFGGAAELESSRSGETRIYVFNEDGRQFFPHEPDGIDRYRGYFSATRGRASPSDSFMTANPLNNDREILMYVRSDYTDWTTVLVASQRALLEPVWAFTKITLIVSLLVLIVTLGISYLLAKKVTIPIKTMHRAIDALDLEMLCSPIQPRLNSNLNELEELSITFQNMQVKLRQSVAELIASRTQEMNSTMLALQAQMNPHSLYNTLATISVMAEEHKDEEIITMCGDLMSILRYTSADDSSLVTVDTECTYTVKYLKCMQIRYGPCLDYTVSIPTEMAQTRIPKLSIQPLVENAIKHGINTVRTLMVEIRGWTENGAWRLCVEDNGPGFDAETLRELRTQMQDFDLSNHRPALHCKGMGLINTYLRLKLLYSGDSCFEIGNNPPGGAYAMIGGTRSHRRQSRVFGAPEVQ